MKKNARNYVEKKKVTPPPPPPKSDHMTGT